MRAGGGGIGLTGPVPRDIWLLLGVVFFSFALQFLPATAWLPAALRLTPEIWRHGFVWQAVTYPFVGAGAQPRHLLAPGVTAGQYQHRNVVAALAPALQHGETVQFWQAQVQDHRVVAGAAADFALDGSDHALELGRLCFDELHVGGAAAGGDAVAYCHAALEQRVGPVIATGPRVG
mgnify:CR=1 FL=1